tara:strand:+ start:39217 stop:39732 length:516 start_codon:yes stop_codon:yes gene_type:complete
MSLRRKRFQVVLGVLVLATAGGFLCVSQHESRVNAAPPAKESARQNAAEKKNAVDNQSDTESKDKPALATFMRQKMEASHDIMEGLLMEDGKLINKAAKKLKDMSDAEHWRVSNDIMYRNHSEDFRSAVDKLIVASKGNSIDRAALSWFDVTLSCIDCHRYVRTMLIAEKN